MAGLLSDADLLEIRQAIKDTTDTFCVTPTVISLRVDNADRMGGEGGIKYNTVNALSFVEFSTDDADMTITSQDGSILRADIRLLLNLADMGIAGLLDEYNQPIINMATDKVTVHGKMYRIVFVGVDGGFEDKNQICYIYGLPEPPET